MNPYLRAYAAVYGAADLAERDADGRADIEREMREVEACATPDDATAVLDRWGYGGMGGDNSEHARRLWTLLHVGTREYVRVMADRVSAARAALDAAMHDYADALAALPPKVEGE